MKKFFKRLFKFIGIMLLIIILLAGVGAGYIAWDNYRVKNTEYTYVSEKIPEEFNGYKICVVSDFHNGSNVDMVLKAVEEASPNLICICGDLVSMEDDDFSNAEALITGLCDIAEVCYVYGNHEIACQRTDYLEKMIADSDVELINDKVKIVEKNGAVMNIAGYGDDRYSDSTEHFQVKAIPRLENVAKSLAPDAPSILIMHRPQYFKAVSELPYDLVLSGHLHGGLINVEKIRNMVLEEHFNTTEYCKGEYFHNGKELIISAGIAHEDNIYRIFNSPEVITVEVRNNENTDSK